MAQKIQSTSLARGRGVYVNNVQAKTNVTNKAMKVLLIGTALAANTTGKTYTSNVRTRVYSADEVGKQAGFGSPIHRAAKKVFKATSGTVEVAVLIQAEAGGAAAATGLIAVTHEATETGTWHVYVDGEHYQVPVNADQTVTTLGDAIVTAMTADPDCPVTPVNAAGTVTLTAKAKGTCGNDISITVNQRAGQFTPVGLTSTITAMSAGAGDPTITSALAALGAGDLANYEADTHLVVCFDRMDTTIMEALSAYNGEANNVEGCYLDTVGRPFVALWADTDPGTNALTALTALGDSYQETDKTNVIVAVPNSPTNPTDIAGYVAGACAAIAQIRPEEPYGNKIMSGIEPGPLATLGASTGNWATEYENRDTAVKSGISTTVVENNVVKLSDVVTLYHPSSISAYSNCYRMVRNVMVVANMVAAWRTLLTSAVFDGISIVADVGKVTSQVDKAKVMDRDVLWSYVVQMVGQFESHAWIYSAESTLDVMKADLDSYIVLRDGGLGWDVVQPTFLSGSAEILTMQIKVDANAA